MCTICVDCDLYGFDIQFFNIFCRYPPSILLLRHFQAFGGSGSNEGSPNDQVGIASDIASVIREYTLQNNEDDEIYAEGDTDGNRVRT